MTLALAGLVAGAVHVLSGPDHLAAIAPYAVADKARSWRTGVRWGLGHSAGVLGVGLLVLLTRQVIPVEALSARSELGVGLVLVGIGIWGIRVALLRRDGRPWGTRQRHVHGRAAFAVGTLHGLAGSSHLLGILPALALLSDAVASSYLLCFGTGSVVAMGTFARSLDGSPAGRVRARSRDAAGAAGTLLADRRRRRRLLGSLESAGLTPPLVAGLERSTSDERSQGLGGTRGCLTPGKFLNLIPTAISFLSDLHDPLRPEGLGSSLEAAPWACSPPIEEINCVRLHCCAPRD